MALSQLERLGVPLDAGNFVAAVIAQHQPLIELFLAAGIDLDTPDDEGRTALFAALASQQWDLAKTLIAGGADPNVADENGRTALMAAVLTNQPELIEALLDAGADPSLAESHGHTALHFALINRDSATALRLLQAGPVLSNAPCCAGHDLFTHALESGDWRLIEPILQALPPTVRWNSLSRAALIEAIEHRRTERVRLLLAKHPLAPTPEGRKQPLLAYALVENNRALLDYMLECGADPNCLLQTPAEKSFLELIPASTVKHYLAEEPGMNLLMLAAGLSRTEDVRRLLAAGAKRNLSTPSKYKLVPLYFAAWAQSPETLQVLLGNSPTPEQMRIEISINSQRASLIKDGVTVLNTSVSTGRSGYPTPQGRFVVTDKHLDHTSTIYKVKMPFFMRLSCREFGMHEGYAASPFASHGCIRVPSGAARKLFASVPIGTLVTITP